MGFFGAESGSKAGGRADGVFSGAASAAGKGRPEKREGSATAGASTASGRNGGGGTAGEAGGPHRLRMAWRTEENRRQTEPCLSKGACFGRNHPARRKEKEREGRGRARGEGAGADIGGREERGRRPCRLRRDVLPHAGLRAPMTGSTTLEELSSAFPHPVADSCWSKKRQGMKKGRGNDVPRPLSLKKDP